MSTIIAGLLVSMAVPAGLLLAKSAPAASAATRTNRKTAADGADDTTERPSVGAAGMEPKRPAMATDTEPKRSAEDFARQVLKCACGWVGSCRTGSGSGPSRCGPLRRSSRCFIPSLSQKKQHAKVKGPERERGTRSPSARHHEAASDRRRTPPEEQPPLSPASLASRGALSPSGSRAKPTDRPTAAKRTRRTNKTRGLSSYRRADARACPYWQSRRWRASRRRPCRRPRCPRRAATCCSARL